jgi:tryptophanyl-tRNA synthetase
MKRLVSGIQPTGTLHIGNYIGAVKQWAELQDTHDAFFFLADYHTLTSRPKPEILRQNTLELTAMLVALGLDPKSCTLFLQSDVPEHTELAWILNNFATLGQLNRMTQFKEKTDQYGQYVGLFTYPVLQTADVALYDGEIVPVGNDQVQHLELSREIIRSLNNHVGEELIKEPKPLITKNSRIMALNDPAKKMSKSIPGSAIGLLDDEGTIVRTIKRAVTDSDPNATTLSPALKNLFALLETFSTAETFAHFEGLQKNGKLQYGELKEQLIEDILAFLKPVQKTYQSLIKREDQLLKILEEGKKKAKPIAEKKIIEVKKALGLLG